MPDKEALKAKLLRNIELIKSVVPDFEMTQEQIDTMLSDKRLAVHEQAKNYKTHADPERNARIEAEASKYLPNLKFPVSFFRNYFHLVKTDGSPASDEYNRKLLTDLTRDDKQGEQARINYMLECLNSPAKLDPNIFNSKTDPADLALYSMQLSDVGGISMENKNMMENMNGITVRNQEKYNWSRKYGETVGGIARDFYATAKDESFMTFPVEFMSKDQMDRLLNGIYSNPQGPLKELGEINDVVKMTLREEERRNLDAASEEYKSKNYGPFTQEDVQFTLNHTERYYGGPENRLQVLSVMMPQLEQAIGDPAMEEISRKFVAWADAQSTVGDHPSKEQREALAASATEISKGLYDVKKRLPADTKPEVYAGLERFVNVIGEFNDQRKIESLYYYKNQPARQEPVPNIPAYRQDFAFIEREFVKTDSKFSRDTDEYTALRNALRQFNEKMAKSGDSYDFDDLNESLYAVNRCAEAYQKKHKGKELSARMQQRLKAISRLQMLTDSAKEQQENPPTAEERLALKLTNAVMMAGYEKKKTQQNADLMTDRKAVRKAAAELKDSPAFRKFLEGKTPQELDALLKTKGSDLYPRYITHLRQFNAREVGVNIQNMKLPTEVKEWYVDFLKTMRQQGININSQESACHIEAAKSHVARTRQGEFTMEDGFFPAIPNKNGAYVGLTAADKYNAGKQMNSMVPLTKMSEDQIRQCYELAKNGELLFRSKDLTKSRLLYTGDDGKLKFSAPADAMNLDVSGRQAPDIANWFPGISREKGEKFYGQMGAYEAAKQHFLFVPEELMSLDEASDKLACRVTMEAAFKEQLNHPEYYSTKELLEERVEIIRTFQKKVENGEDTLKEENDLDFNSSVEKMLQKGLEGEPLQNSFYTGAIRDGEGNSYYRKGQKPWEPLNKLSADLKAGKTVKVLGKDGQPKLFLRAEPDEGFGFELKSTDPKEVAIVPFQGKAL